MWCSYVSWGCTVEQPRRAWPTPATQDTDWAWRTRKWNSSLTQRNKVILESSTIVWCVFFLIVLLLCRILLTVLLFSTWLSVQCYGQKNTYILCVCATGWRGEHFRSSSVRVWVRRPPPASSQRCSCTKRSELHTPFWIQCGPGVF